MIGARQPSGHRARSVTIAAFSMAALLGLAACGEKPQVADHSGQKRDKPAYTGVDGGQTAAGAKAGWPDEAAWSRALTQRAQAQNEHVRIGTRSAAPKSGS